MPQSSDEAKVTPKDLRDEPAGGTPLSVAERNDLSGFADELQLLAGFHDHEGAGNKLHQFAGLELHAADLPQEAPVLKFVDGDLVTVPVPHRNSTHKPHSALP